MADEVIRVFEEGFLHTSQTMWKDKSLSLRDRGLLGTLLSLKFLEDLKKWDYSVRGLETLVPDGKSSIAAGIKSLEEHGYLFRVQENSKGRFKKMKYFISDKPIFRDPKFVQQVMDEYAKNADLDGVPHTEILCPENQPTEKQPTENRPQLNKRILSKEYKHEEEDYTCACEEPLSSSPDELDIPVAGDSESYPGEREVESFKAVYGYDEIDKQISDRYERLYGYDETFNLRNDVWLATEMMIGFIRDRRDFKTKDKTIPYKDMLRSFIHLNPIKTAEVMRKLRDGERWRVIGNKRAYLLAMLYDEGSVSN